MGIPRTQAWGGFNTIKLDRRFTHALPHNRTNAALISAVTYLAHELGVRVVAEGVENATQHQVLKNLGLHEAQGFHLAPPMPLEQALHNATQQHPS